MCGYPEQTVEEERSPRGDSLKQLRAYHKQNFSVFVWKEKETDRGRMEMD